MNDEAVTLTTGIKIEQCVGTIKSVGMVGAFGHNCICHLSAAMRVGALIRLRHVAETCSPQMPQFGRVLQLAIA